MKRFYLFAIYFLCCCLGFEQTIQAQSAEDETFSSLQTSGEQSAMIFQGTPVNLYTGIPSVSIPIYNFSHHSGLQLGVSLNYYAGGIRLNQTPGIAGLGWNLSVGGMVVRNLRGLPDDAAWFGYMNTPAIPVNYDSLAMKYYNDSLDAQQDVFQYSFNGHGGKFVINKRKEIIQIPQTKTRILYELSPTDTLISSFTIITEDGLKYYFKEKEECTLDGTIRNHRMSAKPFSSAWLLSYIVAPFTPDTIKFEYYVLDQKKKINSASHNQTRFISNAYSIDRVVDTVQQLILQKQLMNIYLPDHKRVNFTFEPNKTTDGRVPLLNSVRISDTVFRYGYQLQWMDDRKAILEGLRTYTDKGINKGYQFTYHTPVFPIDSIWNRNDHWGFYNGEPNSLDSIFPIIPGVHPTGCQRDPNIQAIASTLASVKDPAGGITYYDYENNDVYRPFDYAPQEKLINGKVTSYTPISISHVVSNVDTFTLSYAALRKVGNLTPMSVNSELNISILSADSATVLYSGTINLYDLYTNGSNRVFVNNLSSGTYILKAELGSNAAITAKNLFLKVRWNNESPILANSIISPGIRIRQISHFDPVTGKTDTLKTFIYRLPNGRSSGTLGVKPIYHHAFQENVINEALNDYNSVNGILINSNPVNELDFSDGSQVCYKRVEVIKGSLANNLGKEVTEFSSIEDYNEYVKATAFPYPPVFQKDWLFGLPKTIRIYNKWGRLVQETINEFQTQVVPLADSSNTSIKLGEVSRTYLDNVESSPIEVKLEGVRYTPFTGRADLLKTTEKMYYEDGSIQSKTNEIVYDTNYNVIKTISDYNQAKGQKLEKRMYYPYHYSISNGPVATLKNAGIFMPISSEEWITGSGEPRLLSLNVAALQQLPSGYIKPLASYALLSKKPLTVAEIGNFNPAELIRNSNYIREVSRITQYDANGNAVEVYDPETNLYNAVIMGYGNKIPIAKVAQSKLSDAGYTSFEHNSESSWSGVDSSGIRFESITGKQGYELSAGSLQKSGLNPTLTYIVSYWKKGSNAVVSVSGSISSEAQDEQQGWIYVMHQVANSSNVSISGSGIIDELRLYPVAASMTTQTYEPMYGITSTCDANNTIAYNVYDSLYRLVAVRDKDLHVIKKLEYPDFVQRRSSQVFSPFHIAWRIYDSQLQKYKAHCLAYLISEDGIVSEPTDDPNPDHCGQPRYSWLEY